MAEKRSSPIAAGATLKNKAIFTTLIPASYTVKTAEDNSATVLIVPIVETAHQFHHARSELTIMVSKHRASMCTA